MVGCWQEIHHRPGPSKQGQPVAQSDKQPVGDEISASQSEETVFVAENANQEDNVSPLGSQSSETFQPQPPEESPEESSGSKVAEVQEDISPPALVPETVLDPETVDTHVQETTDQIAAPLSTETAHSVWKLSSQWSMAAALQAKGKNLDALGKQLDFARGEAEWLGIDLPSLPFHEPEADRLQKNLAFLLDEGGQSLTKQLQQELGDQAAALAELATKTNVLLLSYSPKWTRLDAVVASIRHAAENPGLPASVWGELVNLLAKRADFQQVKSSIFQLHRSASKHLSPTAE